MNKVYLIAGLMMAAAIGIFAFNLSDVQNYSTFSVAESTGDKVTIIGQLAKEKSMDYDPVKDPNYFAFFVKDKDGVEKRVVWNHYKPQDFERSEQLTLTGQFKNGEFIASDVLMKCPSKYKEEELQLKAQNG